MEMIDGMSFAFMDNKFVQAALIVVMSFLVARVGDWLLKRTLSRWARRTRSDIDDEIIALLHGPVVKTIVLSGFCVATRRLAMPDDVTLFTLKSLHTIILVVWVIFTFSASKLLMGFASRQATRFRVVDDRTYPLFDNLAKILIVAIGVYLLIQTWDIDATGWIASAGIVGLAISFAAKDTLANLFAGVFIIADAPYRVGDFVVLDTGERGKVVNIGLRSTRVLTRDDIELTIPNSLIGNAKISNESAGPSVKHRVRLKANVAYGSDIDRVRQILLDIAGEEENVCESPNPRVRLRSLGESGLNLELLCWIPEPALRGRVLDALNTQVYKRFAGDGIEIPYPKRDLFIREMPGKKGAAPEMPE